MKTSDVPLVPISEIKILNPRPRNKQRFGEIVSSIGTVGLKVPITVSKREMSPDGTQFDLVCGQGRLEAFVALGQHQIPAIVITASREDQFLMSLIENIARRPPSHVGLLKETMRLREKGNSIDQIAVKLGFASRYIATIVTLLDKGEVELLRLVESGRVPLTVAAEISKGTSGEVQRALAEAYEAGDLRGSKLRTARALINRRLANPPNSSKKVSKAPLNGHDLATEYREHTRSHRELVKKAAVVNERLTLVAAACRKLFADEAFVALLRTEQLSMVSERLVELTNGK